MDLPVRNVSREVWRENGTSGGTRAVPEETAVAMTYNGGAYAVMMATPRDLRDFAIGFSLAERIVASPDDIRSLDIIDLHDDRAGSGVELRMWLPDAMETRLRDRRRQIAGPTGCGLCGLDSIGAALRPPEPVQSTRQFSPRQVMAAMQAMPPLQTLNLETRAVHAAAFWTPARGIAVLREDVGRHNALDKLAGALAQERIAATDGMVLLTSRVSVEMVQKTATMNAAVLVSVSAPTALAVRMAQEAGVTLVAVARGDGFEVFTHPARVMNADAAQDGVVDVDRRKAQAVSQ